MGEEKEGRQEPWGVVGRDKEPLQSIEEKKNVAIRLAPAHNQWFILHFRTPYNPPLFVQICEFLDNTDFDISHNIEWLKNHHYNQWGEMAGRCLNAFSASFSLTEADLRPSLITD